LALTQQTDMTKGLFDLAEMGGKTDKMGSINPMMRQGLAHGQSATDRPAQGLTGRGSAARDVPRFR
jgi:hypothetical protein